MKFYGKSEEVVNNIIDVFKSGNLPEKLSPIFINRKDNITSKSWSFLNKFHMIINNTLDARTFNQWNSVGRKVKKDTHSFCILGPCLKVIKDPEDETKFKKFLYGFKGIPVFRIEDTEIVNQELWESKSGVDQKEEEFLNNLPLREVAEKWGIKIINYNGREYSVLGYYVPGQVIAIGVKNLSTFCHELVHAADDKLGTLIKSMGQEPSNEIVAETGGAVLLKILGFDYDADLSGCWDYVNHYAGNDKDKTIKKITELINRICSSVSLILETSDNILKSMS
jgi:hypothetical protein